jgi:hypothetical protein
MNRTMTRDNGVDWIYTDEFGNVWRLIPTGERDMPFVMTIMQRST